MNLILVVGFIGRTKVDFRIFTLLGRFAPREGFVILRQTFVRRCHGGFSRLCERLQPDL